MSKLLIIAASPRVGGNTDTMADWAQAECQAMGLVWERLNLRDYAFSPCIECNACYQDGHCHVKDGMQAIYPKLLEATKIILAAPVFFYTFGGLAKAFIDRTQCYWAAKFVLKQHPVADEEHRRARQLLPLACGGTNFPDTFSCYQKVLKNFCMMIEVQCQEGVFLPGIDAKDDILKDTAYRQAVKQAVALFGGQ